MNPEIQPAAVPPTQPTHRKLLLGIIIVGVMLVAAGLLVVLHKQSTEKPPAYAHPVAYNNPLHPAPGTQQLYLTIRNAKLASGPAKIYSVVNGAIMLNFTFYGNLKEYDIYINDNGVDNEIDSDQGGGKVTGQIYLQTKKAGTFEFGYHTDNTGKIKLGTLIVK